MTRHETCCLIAILQLIQNRSHLTVHFFPSHKYWMQNSVSRYISILWRRYIDPTIRPAFSKELSEHIATSVLQLCIFPLSARSWWLYISNIQKVYYFSSLVLQYLSTNEIFFTIYSERSMTFLGSFDRCNASLVSGTSVSFILWFPSKFKAFSIR